MILYFYIIVYKIQLIWYQPSKTTGSLMSVMFTEEIDFNNYSTVAIDVGPPPSGLSLGGAYFGATNEAAFSNTSSSPVHWWPKPGEPVLINPSSRTTVSFGTSELRTLQGGKVSLGFQAANTAGAFRWYSLRLT